MTREETVKKFHEGAAASGVTKFLSVAFDKNQGFFIAYKCDNDLEKLGMSQLLFSAIEKELNQKINLNVIPVPVKVTDEAN